MTFEKVFELAKKAHLENKEVEAKRIQEKEKREKEKKNSEEERRQQRILNANPETECYSKELFGLIQQFNFVIDSYEKFTEFDPDDYYDRTMEIYYCSFGNWEFKVSNYSDVDIVEGIFALNSIKHKETKEEVDFYCDLGCRNTSKARVDEVLNFLEFNSLQEYIDDKYHRYLVLPQLLREKGYEVEEVDYSFKLNKPSGYLKLEKGIYVKVYKAWRDNFQVVVTNDNTWDVNGGNYSNERKRAYYFDYNSTEDVTEFCKCIEAFKEDQKGHIGFFDEETNKYYSNRDVLAFFSSLRDKENYYKESWNHYLIRVENKRFWDKRGYDEENSKIVNKYKGLELYTETTLSFNDASQWSIGDKKNTSIITFEYDKRKNDKQCRLCIENYIYEDYLEDWDDEYEEQVIEQTKLVSKIEQFGAFSELMEILEQYVHTMIEIHEIQL